MAQRNSNEGGKGPLLLIGLILLATIAGIYWISQSGNSAPASEQTNTQDTGKSAAEKYNSAPAGASPMSFKGGEAANIVFEEFADFQCGACAQKHPVFNEVISEYGDKIKFVFRHFPIIQQHPKAYDAAVATEAASFQGKFWEMQNRLFREQQKWSSEPNHRKRFDEYAQSLGLDADQYSRDALGIRAKTRVDLDMQRGNALGVRSTPTLYMNGKPLPFSDMTVERLKTLIDKELQGETKNNSESEDRESKEKEEGEKAEKKAT